MVRYIKESIEDDFDDMFDFGDENAEWYEGGENIPKECIKGATLLSKEEYEEYRNNVPKIDDCWWLRSAGCLHNYGRLVFKDGDTMQYFVYDPYFGIRPALILNLQSSNLEAGDNIDFGGHLFTIISSDLAICDDIIGRNCFREDGGAEDANVYERSDVKKVVDDWFNKVYNEYEG